MSWLDDDDIYQQWNLREIPFAESAEKLTSIHPVFTGRDDKLREVSAQWRSRDAKSILIYGWVGVGKTAFMREVLEGANQKWGKRVLTARISLEPNIDLATAALIALAQEMPNDEAAESQLYQMGIPTARRPKERSSEISGSMGIGGKIGEKDLPPIAPKFPNISFDALLERALNNYSYERVIIAIDDLDKQDPARARQLLLDAQGLLKGRAWLMLTGQPAGITRDYLIRDRGLFDLEIKLERLDQETSYTMLKRYLASARYAPVDDTDEAAAVHPFTPKTLRELCRQANGVPRMLNRLASYVLIKATELPAPKITDEVLAICLDYARQRLTGQLEITAEDYFLLDVILEKGVLSDDTVTLEELTQLKAETFSEILPQLDKLVELDLLQRLPTERATAYAPMPLLDSSNADDEETNA